MDHDLFEKINSSKSYSKCTLKINAYSSCQKTRGNQALQDFMAFEVWPHFVASALDRCNMNVVTVVQRFALNH